MHSKQVAASAFGSELQLSIANKAWLLLQRFACLCAVEAWIGFSMQKNFHLQEKCLSESVVTGWHTVPLKLMNSQDIKVPPVQSILVRHSFRGHFKEIWNAAELQAAKSQLRRKTTTGARNQNFP